MNECLNGRQPAKLTCKRAIPLQALRQSTHPDLTPYTFTSLPEIDFDKYNMMLLSTSKLTISECGPASVGKASNSCIRNYPYTGTVTNTIMNTSTPTTSFNWCAHGAGWAGLLSLSAGAAGVCESAGGGWDSSPSLATGSAAAASPSESRPDVKGFPDAVTNCA